MMNWKTGLVGCSMALMSLSAFAETPEAKTNAAASSLPRLEFNETLLGVVTPTAEYNRVTVSQDHKHIAFPILKDGSWHVLRDGVIEGTNRAISRIEVLRFSPEGSHLVYFAKLKSGEWITVCDDKASPPYARDASSLPVFSSNGEHMAFAISRGADQVLVLDGKEIQTYSGAYLDEGRRSGKDQADVRTLVFGGSHLSYAVVGKEGHYVVTDGKPGKKYQAIALPGPRYSPDGTLYYGACLESNQWVIVRNGQEGAPIMAKAIMDFTFAASNNAALGYLRLQDSPLRMCAVVNDKPGRDYYAIGVDTLRLSANGERVLYAAGTDVEQRLVVDGQDGPIYSGIAPRTPCFSPDGQHYAYGAASGNASVAVIDGKEWGRFDYFVPASFAYSPDSRHLVFVGTRKDKAVLVVDQVEVREFDLIQIPDKDLFYGKMMPVFDSPDRFHIQIARRNQDLDVAIFKVDVMLP